MSLIIKKKVRKAILLVSILALTVWLFWPLSQCGRMSFAKDDMEFILFDYNKINSQLFSGPVIKYDHGKEWFEWYHVDGRDTIAVGVNVSEFRLLNYFPAHAYFIGKDSLWDKIFETDTVWWNKKKK